MANLSDYPVQSRKCGAHCRTTGQPCRTWAMPNGRCKMHGGKSPGALRGELHPNYKTGRYTQEAREVGKLVRQIAKAADVLGARSIVAAGMKPIKAIRRKRHVRRALANAKEKETIK